MIEETAVLNSTTKNKNNNAGLKQTDEESGVPLWKRILDFAIILFLLPGALLIGVCISILIKCGSRGPVLFKQRRVGYKGREFTCYKFRTMRVDADVSCHQGHTAHLIRNGGAMVKLDAGNDPRLIPFGAALRASGLDELPQLINVVRGEMSFVGPRPCVPYEFELYEPWQRQRCDAVPGLTGLWQVSGKNRTTFNQMVHLDIEYSRRQSLWLDLKIVFKTVPALWTQCADTIEQKRKLKRGAKPAVMSAPVNVGKPVHSHS